MVTLIDAGIATLASGTVTVSVTNVQSGDSIIVTNNTPNTNRPHYLPVYQVPDSSIVTNTSFVINSLTDTAPTINENDNGTVNWVIVRP